MKAVNSNTDLCNLINISFENPTVAKAEIFSQNELF